MSTDRYHKYCWEREIKTRPAPMQLDMVRFFIKMLIDEDDLVLDPFGGSNSTGAIARELGRHWVAIEPNRDYVEGSKGRFPQFAGTSPTRRQAKVLFTEP
jgi:DNA modification methylase